MKHFIVDFSATVKWKNNNVNLKYLKKKKWLYACTVFFLRSWNASKQICTEEAAGKGLKAPANRFAGGLLALPIDLDGQGHFTPKVLQKSCWKDFFWRPSVKELGIAVEAFSGTLQALGLILKNPA